MTMSNSVQLEEKYKSFLNKKLNDVYINLSDDKSYQDMFIKKRRLQNKLMRLILPEKKEAAYKTYGDLIRAEAKIEKIIGVQFFFYGVKAAFDFLHEYEKTKEEVI